jgi:glycosyltransferase involved in cell wall biosynthesis
MRLLSIGSLTPQKGHARLIDAFASIAAAHPEWDLMIIGEGSERSGLEEQICRHRLEQRVRLPGLTRDVLAEIEGAQLFAFPSHYEGFPNALAEAVSAGLPSVGYVGVSGVEELIKPHVTGLLVEPRAGLPGLSSALSTLMADGELRRTFGNAARSHSAHWTPSRIFQTWDELLVEAVGGRVG